MKLPKIPVDSTRWPCAMLPWLLALAALSGPVGCGAPAQSGTAVAAADTAQPGDTTNLSDSKPGDTAGDTAAGEVAGDAAADTASKDGDTGFDTADPGVGDGLPADLVEPKDGDDAATPADAGDGSGGSDASDSDTAPSTCSDGEKWCNHSFVWTAQGDESSVEARGSWDGWKVGIPLTLSGSTWSGSGLLPQGQQFVYKFRIVRQSGKEDWQPDPSASQLIDDGYGGKNAVLPPLSCPSDGVCPAPKTICGVPAKLGAFDWRDAVLYFVFVDRFANGDPSNDQKASSADLADIANWNGGDWKGVTQKITSGYFKELGVNALWLTVPMDNTAAVEFGDDGKKYTAYHGYWPKDVNQPNSHFGAMADLQALVQAAHAQGIQVVLDYAMNHVHKDSPIFQNHPEWFHPLSVGGQECVCGSGVCPWDGPSGVWCWFRNYLPDFDFDNADARKASIDNVIWWMQQSGADGLRLDAIKHVEGAWLTELRTRLLNEVEPVRGQHIWLVGETYTGDQG
ncbi:MAG: hypothetical protein HY902_20725, partial [Deltaproteobacteria bacterium]|nr:hypothetical protein [Deltaproteobacteria bacterium]